MIFYPTIDSWMNFNQPTTNYGSAAYTYAPRVQYIGAEKSMLGRWITNFDISTLAGKTLTAAKLRFYSAGWFAAAAATIYRCTRPITWTEYGVCWNFYDGTNGWSTPGGDYDGTTPTPVGFTTPEGGWFEVTGLLDFAQYALDNSVPVSFIVRLDNEAPGSNAGTGLYTREDATRKPEFIVNYVGEPVSLVIPRRPLRAIIGR